jgi:viologen exporter family transport system permease protein
MSLRGAFLLESFLMLGNNLIFFFTWWIFFHQFDEIRGWHFDDMATMMAIGIGSYGLMQICFGGVRELGNLIIAGDLDPLMTQPKNLMLQIASSRSLRKGWGHLATTVILLFFNGLTSLITLSLVLLCLLCGCLVYTSFTFIVHSFTFWAGPIESLSRKVVDTLLLLSLYPTHIYSGFLQLVLFTVIPAGIVGYLPVELVRHFSWSHLAVFLGATLIFIISAISVFHRGLKRYESGNLFGGR